MTQEPRILIDVRRGLTANSPDFIKDPNKRIVSNLPLAEQITYGKQLVALDVNRKMENGSTITEDNISFAVRCSAMIRIVYRYLDHKLSLPEGRTIRSLQIKPAYSLFRDASESVGWVDEYTHDFRDITSDTERMNEIRRVLDESENKDDIRLFIINSPNNPTGEVYPKRFLREIMEIMHEYPNLYVLSDVIYEKMADAPTLFKLADDELRQRIFEVTGISKTVMPGDRNSVGYLYTGLTHATEINRLLEMEDSPITKDDTHILDEGRMSCLITAMLLTDSKFYDDTHKYYDRRKAILKKEFAAAFAGEGVTMTCPDELYYIILNFEGSGLTSDEVVEQMLERHGIALLAPEKVGFRHKCLRFSLGTAIVDNSLKGQFIDDERNADFYDSYKDQYFSSDLEVYKFILEKTLETVRDMRIEKGLVEGAHAARVRAQDGQLFGRAV